jgi:transcription initiation factor TFIIH subunit 2
MADSDPEYVADDGSDDDLMDHRVTSTADGDGPRRNPKKPGKAAWEDVKRSWEAVLEGADGQLSVAEALEAEKRRRLLRDTTPLQRGIIRHLVLVVDMSFAMAEKDLLPTRYRLAVAYAADFVREYFEQNPISQMGVVGMRDGIAVRISEMGGNPAGHLEQLAKWKGEEPMGVPSLQNALEMCRGTLL